MSDFAALTPRARARRLSALARAALAEYGLADAPIARQAGFYNASFRVETPRGPCALRIMRPAWRTPAQLRSEMQWLAALHRDTDLAVPGPIATRRGGLFTLASTPEVPEPRLCALFRWMPGRFFVKGLRPAHLERVGAFTARLHEQALGFALPDGFTREPVGALTTAQAERAVRVVASNATAEDARAVEAALAKAERALDGVAREPGQCGLIHADLHQFNYLFHHGEVRAIDFDDCGIGPLLYDFAVTINTLGSRPNLAELRAALLRGYRSVRPLPAQTETRLDALIVVRILQDIPGVLDTDDPSYQEWLPSALEHGLPRLRSYAGS